MISENAEETARKSEQTMMAWIVVLAVAITCCAILFVIFANYLVVINKNLSSANAQLMIMESNESQLLSELQAMHRTMMANQKAQQPQPPAQPPASAPPSPAAPPSPVAPPSPPPVTH